MLSKYGIRIIPQSSHSKVITWSFYHAFMTKSKYGTRLIPQSNHSKIKIFVVDPRLDTNKVVCSRQNIFLCICYYKHKILGQTV